MNEFMITMLLMMGPPKYRLSDDMTKLYFLVDDNRRLVTKEGDFSKSTAEELNKIITLHNQFSNKV